MANRKWINATLVIAACLVVGIFAFSVRLEASPDAVAVLRTQGMTCGSCAARIENALKAQEGIASVQVNVDAGRVVVGFDSKRIRPETIAERVTGTGYGTSILQVVTPEQYKTMTGQSLVVSRPGGGCGGGCCDAGRTVR
ncbi:heavy-metal-associated domain-containing protein [Geobacter sp.]|uniref:heavy-metal-associated domain-containing protein n=1 Tax=Geobacter sp. TaxID=46610 RepID=UPI002632E9EA|nr:heavy-metal-associated domain-containing protein [Geobacter sp.]